jgi:Type II secretory pathway, ATPase PulE/Tfp pilus assembly pathway, ATPase PilB
MGVFHNIYQELDQTIRRQFGKDLRFYRSKMREYNVPNEWQTICEIEGYDPGDLFNLINKSIQESQAKYNVKYFVFSQEEVDSTDKNVKEYAFFPTEFLSYPEEQLDRFLSNTVIYLKPITKETNISIKQNTDIEEVGQKLFADILTKAIKKNTSDIHIIPKKNKYALFFRIDGVFVEQKELSLLKEDADALTTYLLRKSAEKVKGSFNPDNRLTVQDAKMTVDFIPNVKDLDIRLAFVPNGLGEGDLEVVIRLLYKKNASRSEFINVEETLLKLGYLPEDVPILLNAVKKRSGLIVVSGITNSGKSTLITHMRASVTDKKIGTIEDPIEFWIPNENISQHHIFVPKDENLQIDFVDYVRAFNRSDYDIIFVGEWRRHNSLTEAILEQAYAGQLIMTTLHIPTSFHIFEGLRTAFGVDPTYVYPVLLLSFNQTLIPTLCPHCKVPLNQKLDQLGGHSKLLGEIRNAMATSIAMLPDTVASYITNLESLIQEDVVYTKGNGCEHCNYTGYAGRTPIYDYFLPSSDLEAEWNVRNTNTLPPSLILRYSPVKKLKVHVFLKKIAQGIVDIFDYRYVV